MSVALPLPTALPASLAVPNPVTSSSDLILAPLPAHPPLSTAVSLLPVNPLRPVSFSLGSERITQISSELLPLIPRPPLPALQPSSVVPCPDIPPRTAFGLSPDLPTPSNPLPYDAPSSSLLHTASTLQTPLDFLPSLSPACVRSFESPLLPLPVLSSSLPSESAPPSKPLHADPSSSLLSSIPIQLLAKALLQLLGVDLSSFPGLLSLPSLQPVSSVFPLVSDAMPPACGNVSIGSPVLTAPLTHPPLISALSAAAPCTMQTALCPQASTLPDPLPPPSMPHHSYASLFIPSPLPQN